VVTARGTVPYPARVTVLEVIQRSSEFLGKRGVDAPRLQTELLLAHVLGLPRMKLYLDFERQLNASELDRLRQFVKRRGEREPLQHIVGTTSFHGLELEVTREALIPRPETELLASKALGFLAGRNGASVLDFGTGSGCLAVVLAALSAAVVHALDISEAALALAGRNAARHALVERIRFHLGDGFAALPAELTFDLIVSNPPYIPTDEIASLEPEVRDHDPRLALDGGVGGLDFYRRLAREATSRLNAEGRLMVELGDGQDAAARALFAAAGWRIEAVEPDDTGRPRILIACREA
jgi:release factor glutamine methyltransferase